MIKLPGTSPDGAENGLPAGLDQGHVGVREAEMVTDLVDQHVADDAVQRLAVSVGVTEDGDAAEKDPVGRLAGSNTLLNGSPTP